MPTSDLLEDSLAEHQGWLAEQRELQRRKLDELPRRGHPNQRLFSDGEFRAAYAEAKTARAMAQKLQCTETTARIYANRLGLPLTNTQRAAWSEADDACLRDCAAGKVSMHYVAQTTGHSHDTMRRRAAELGIVVRERRCGDKTGKKMSIPVAHDFYDAVINVGTDKLLYRLRKVHGAPRDEVYPGSVRAA